MESKRLRGNIMLLLTALIWGCAFVAQDVGMDYVGPLTFNAVRALIGTIVIIPVIFLTDFLQKKNGSPKSAESRSDWRLISKAGILCGAALFAASSCQQIGIALGTTSGKAGFITAFYILLVPVAQLLFGRKPRPVIWLCIISALAGLYLLCVTESASIAIGDILVMCSAIFYTVQIMLIDHYSPKLSGVRLAFVQFLVFAVLSFISAFLFEEPAMSSILDAKIPILYAGVLSCGVAYTLQILAQKDTDPTVASLLMSLESVFAVLAGIVILRQVPSPREYIGCLLMFAAIIAAQLPERRRQFSHNP